jgi:hypothetical protein
MIIAIVKSLHFLCFLPLVLEMEEEFGKGLKIAVKNVKQVQLSSTEQNYKD